ncbi:MAG: hypothetical protein ACK5MD_10215 [Flavobacteriales bacterium]
MGKKYKMNTFNWFLVMFSSIFIIWGIYNSYKLNNNDNECTEGVVISSGKITGRRASAIEYYVNNKKYIFTTNKKYRKGSILILKYEKNNPDNVKVITECDVNNTLDVLKQYEQTTVGF